MMEQAKNEVNNKHPTIDAPNGNLIIPVKVYMPEVAVAVLPENLTQAFRSLTDSCENWDMLEDFINEKMKKNQLSYNYKVSVLLQISHCLLQLQQNQIPCRKLSSSEVFIQEKNCGKNDSNCINIKNLANIYCFVLTRKKLDDGNLPPADNFCKDPDIALDLLRKMRNGTDFTIEDVLKHPFHWSDEQKITFICRAFDLIYPECGDMQKDGIMHKKARDAVKKYKIDETSQKEIIPSEGWFNKLVLTDEEKPKVSILQAKAGFKDIIEKETIYDTAFNQSGAPKFVKDSIFDLMRFFRNNFTHYQEKNRKVKFAFGGYDNYWNFYSHRFPGFFMHVYSRMKDELVRHEMSTEPIAPNQYLP